MTCFNYTHKKFDILRKRIREDEEQPNTPSKKIKYPIESIVKEELLSTTTKEIKHSIESIVKKEKDDPKNTFSVPPELLKLSIAELANIPEEALLSLCKYHENMARKYPTRNRSQKDQAKRDKNTVACRVSRRIKKVEEIQIEEQYKESKEKYLENLIETQKTITYIKELLKLPKIIDCLKNS